MLPLQAQKVEILGGELVKIRQGEVVAKVNKETGAVTGMEPGFATIKASYNDKVYDVVTVQVEPK